MTLRKATRRAVQALGAIRAGASIFARSIGGRSQLVTPGGTLAPLPALTLPESKVAQIERRIFSGSPTQALGPLVDISEVIGALPKHVSSEAQLDRLQTRILRNLLIQPASAPTAVRARPESRLKQRVAASLAVALLCTGLVGASTAAKPGQIAYPVKLQVEAIRLAFAGDPIAKARVHLSMAEERIREIRSVPATPSSWLLVETIGRLDGTILAAYDYLRRVAPSSELNSSLVMMLRVLRTQEKLLATMLESAPPSAAPRLVESLSLAQHLIVSIEPRLNAPNIAESLEGIPSRTSTFMPSSTRNSAKKQSGVSVERAAGSSASYQGDQGDHPADEDESEGTGGQQSCPIQQTGTPLDILRNMICPKS